MEENYFYFDIETAPKFTLDDYKKSYEKFFKIENEIRVNKELKVDELVSDIDKEAFYKFYKGGLNPYDGRIVAISSQLNNEQKKFLISEPAIDEKYILREFYEELKNVRKLNPIFVGFNILNFDMPFLIAKIREHNIEAPKLIHKTLFTRSIDLMQIHLPLNEFSINGLSFINLCKAYDIKTKEDSGKIIRDLFYSGDKTKIKEYVEKEFVFQELFEKIKSSGLIKNLVDLKENLMPNN